MKRVLLSTILACTALMGMAWGQKGHDVTAAIAERHLNPAAKAAVDKLLDGKSIIYWANWLDNASHTPEYSYSKTWHYKNVNDGVRYEEMSAHPAGDAVTAIKSRLEILRNPQASDQDKALALKMLIHITGDIHQPMHMGHATDLGGNRVKVKFFGRDANLHSVWDSNIVDSGHKWSYTEWADQIDRYSGDMMELVGGTPAKWGEQTWQVAAKVYMDTPENSSLSYDYIALWTPVVEEQLQRGGLRLAHILNSIFDPEYRSTL